MTGDSMRRLPACLPICMPDCLAAHYLEGLLVVHNCSAMRALTLAFAFVSAVFLLLDVASFVLGTRRGPIQARQRGRAWTLLVPQRQRVLHSTSNHMAAAPGHRFLLVSVQTSAVPLAAVARLAVTL